jgi:osmotically-inducible protein OsmY
VSEATPWLNEGRAASMMVWGPLLVLVVAGLGADAHAVAPLPSSLALAGAAEGGTDVARAVLRKLSRDPHIRASTLTVTERDGIVQLSGSVPVVPWRVRAARIASVVRGVRAVVNRVSVVPVIRGDEVVAGDVRRSLRATAALAHLPIAVRVTNGVVELSGVISTWEEQQLAERVASGVPGARFCHNQLIWSRGMRRTSRMIVGDVRSRLAWDPLVQGARIEVVVRHRRVELAGTVGSPAERRRAIAHAWVKGVIAVDAKHLVVDVARRPDDDVRSRFPTDAEISAALADTMPLWPSLAASKVSTSVVGGVVTLRGNVPTLAEKRAAEEMARSAVGVVSVTSELRGPWWRPPEPARRAPRKSGRRPPRAR